MTPEDYKNAIIGISSMMFTKAANLASPQIREVIDEMIAEAVEAEREACAQIADENGKPFMHREREKCGKDIATAIRARSTPQSDSAKA